MDSTVSNPPPGFSKKEWSQYADQEVEITGTGYCFKGKLWVEVEFVDGKMAGERRWFQDGELVKWRQDAKTCAR